MPRKEPSTTSQARRPPSGKGASSGRASGSGHGHFGGRSRWGDGGEALDRFGAGEERDQNPPWMDSTNSSTQQYAACSHNRRRASVPYLWPAPCVGVAGCGRQDGGAGGAGPRAAGGRVHCFMYGGLGGKHVGGRHATSGSVVFMRNGVELGCSCLPGVATVACRVRHAVVGGANQDFAAPDWYGQGWTVGGSWREGGDAFDAAHIQWWKRPSRPMHHRSAYRLPTIEPLSYRAFVRQCHTISRHGCESPPVYVRMHDGLVLPDW
jgi:hypothetical protein